MSESLVKTDNDLVWDGVVKPFIEFYDFLLTHPEGNWALWIQLVLNIPETHKNPALSTVQACFITKEGQKIVLKNDFDLKSHDVVHTDQFIKIDETVFSLADCFGGAQKEDQFIRWELSFEDPVLSYQPYPKGLTRLAKFKHLCPRLIGHVSGNIFVNHKKYSFTEAKMTQNHSFGTRPPQKWAQATCLHFADDTEAFFHAMNLKMSGRIPTLSFVMLGFEGQEFRLNSWVEALGTTRSEINFDAWKIHFQKKGYRFACRLWREPDFTIGLPFPSFGETEPTHYLSPLSHIEIQIHKKHHGMWQDYKILKGTQTALFETRTPDVNFSHPHHEVAFDTA